MQSILVQGVELAGSQVPLWLTLTSEQEGNSKREKAGERGVTFTELNFLLSLLGKPPLEGC